MVSCDSVTNYTNLCAVRKYSLKGKGSLLGPTLIRLSLVPEFGRIDTDEADTLGLAPQPHVDCVAINNLDDPARRGKRGCAARRHRK